MKRACAKCALVLDDKHLRDGICIGCEWDLERLVEPVHSVHSDHPHECAACGHPAFGDLCWRCDDFVST